MILTSEGGSQTLKALHRSLSMSKSVKVHIFISHPQFVEVPKNVFFIYFFSSSHFVLVKFGHLKEFHMYT